MNEVADGLFVGDRQDASCLGSTHKFDAVVTLIDGDFEATTSQIPLRDGQNDDQTAFNEAVDTVLEAWDGDNRVFVHCSVGASRSVTVAATAMAARTGRTLRETLNEVEQKRPQANPHPALVEHGYAYLGTEPSRPFDTS